MQRSSSASASERLAWARLSRTACGPSQRLRDRVDSVGAISAAAEIADPYDARATADLHAVAAMGGRFVTPQDPDWPAESWTSRAADISEDTDPVAPLGLWTSNAKPLDELTSRAVAIVGTRAPSNYGSKIAAELADAFAARGWTVVGDGGYGIAAVAHRAALAVGGRSLAVLPCGPDIQSPRAHTQLLRQIGSLGMVLSEYPPGTLPSRQRRTDCSRIVAALSRAVIVVEAGMYPSASLTAASWASRLGRTVAAVPGPTNAATSPGCNYLIRHSGALVVTGADDLVIAFDSHPG